MRNKTLINAAKKILLEELNDCNEQQQHKFKRMYSSNKNQTIEEVVQNMDSRKIDFAITQTQNTKKNE